MGAASQLMRRIAGKVHQDRNRPVLLRPVFELGLAASRSQRQGYFEDAAVGRLLEEHYSRQHNREGLLWAVVCFSTWLRLSAGGGAPGHRYEPAAPAPLLCPSA